MRSVVPSRRGAILKTSFRRVRLVASRWWVGVVDPGPAVGVEAFGFPVAQRPQRLTRRRADHVPGSGQPGHCRWAQTAVTARTYGQGPTYPGPRKPYSAIFFKNFAQPAVTVCNRC